MILYYFDLWKIGKSGLFLLIFLVLPAPFDTTVLATYFLTLTEFVTDSTAVRLGENITAGKHGSIHNWWAVGPIIFLLPNNVTMLRQKTHAGPRVISKYGEISSSSFLVANPTFCWTPLLSVRGKILGLRMKRPFKGKTQIDVVHSCSICSKAHY